jgi:hypothetical protein
MEHSEPSFAQASEYLLKVGTSKDRLYPTVSGSNRRLDGISERNSEAAVVFPQPKVPLSQTITWSCYERSHSRSRGERATCWALLVATRCGRARR